MCELVTECQTFPLHIAELVNKIETKNGLESLLSKILELVLKKIDILKKQLALENLLRYVRVKNSASFQSCLKWNKIFHTICDTLIRNRRFQSIYLYNQEFMQQKRKISIKNLKSTAEKLIKFIKL